MTYPCGCPKGGGITMSDRDKHLAFHDLVVEQGGPAGLVDANTLREARGFRTGTLDGETVIDVKARESGKRASGQLREACR